MEIVDKSGQMRSEKDFLKAREIVGKRLVTMSLMNDPELMLELTTIIQALEIAAMVARASEEKK